MNEWQDAPVSCIVCKAAYFVQPSACFICLDADAPGLQLHRACLCSHVHPACMNEWQDAPVSCIVCKTAYFVQPWRALHPPDDILQPGNEAAALFLFVCSCGILLFACFTALTFESPH
jgi:hypothetical protein